MSNTTKVVGTEKKPANREATTKSAGKTTASRTTQRSASKVAPATSSTPTRLVSAEEREKMIAQAAYLRAERRGFIGGDPVADWLEAEIEIDSMLSQSSH